MRMMKMTMGKMMVVSENPDLSYLLLMCNLLEEAVAANVH